MKRSILICGYLSIFFACNGAEEKNNSKSLESSRISTEQNLKNEESSNELETFEVPTENVLKTGDSEVKNDVDSVDPREILSRKEALQKSNQVKNEGVKAEEPKSSTAPSNPVKQEKKKQKANVVFISVVPDLMKFDKEVFTVIAGQEVVIELDNPDGMQHNMVISKPGTLKKLGAAADALARDPKGAQKQYVPEIPEVLFATALLEPGDVFTLTFTAPSEPGDYPFVCTFPGHWRMMNGIMKVTK